MSPLSYLCTRARRCTVRRHTAAFTLIEIMIVTLIIGILLSIAIPNFTRTREVARQKSCVANLKQIEMAKELWAMDNHGANGDTVSLSLLVGTYITPNPPPGTPPGAPINLLCPTSGLPYSTDIGVIGTLPLCPTVAARTGTYPHVLP